MVQRYDEGDAYSEDGFNGRLTLPNVESAVSAEAPRLTMDRSKLDAMLEKLAGLAVGRENGWQRARQWIESNLSGEDRTYAESVLQAKTKAAEVPALIEPQKADVVS